MPSRLTPVTFRFAIPSLVATAALAAGCVLQAPPPAPQATMAPVASATNPAPTTPATSGTGGMATDQPVAIASPAVDSDLPADDNAALQSVVDSDQLSAYLPSDLIHDGGVILFRTMAVDDRAAGATTTTTSDAEPDQPPSDWKRSDGKRVGGRKLEIRGEGNGQVGTASLRQARMTVRYAIAGSLDYRGAAGRQIHKAFTETYNRTFKFKFDDNRWQLDKLSPLRLESEGGHGGLDLERVQVFANTQDQPLTEVNNQDRFDNPSEVPAVKPGDSLRIEATARKTDAGKLFVFAYLVGGADRARMMLVDDGTQGDKKAGDGIYTGTVIVPAAEGLRHVAVDAIDGSSFTAGGRYRSEGVAATFNVKAQ